MLFFEYYSKYNSSPTEHQVFTSPPIERSIYFVHHHVLPLSVFIFQEHSSFNELMLRGSPRPLRCSRTLARPPLCSGTRQTTSCSGTLGDSPDHSVLWDFWSDHSALGDSPDHSVLWDFSPDHSVLGIYTSIVYGYMHANVMAMQAIRGYTYSCSCIYVA
jgi:hypothetical protein